MMTRTGCRHRRAQRFFSARPLHNANGLVNVLSRGTFKEMVRAYFFKGIRARTAELRAGRSE
jgi:hypothetical protein